MIDYHHRPLGKEWVAETLEQRWAQVVHSSQLWTMRSDGPWECPAARQGAGRGAGPEGAVATVRCAAGVRGSRRAGVREAAAAARRGVVVVVGALLLPPWTALPTPPWTAPPPPCCSAAASASAEAASVTAEVASASLEALAACIRHIPTLALALLPAFNEVPTDRRCIHHRV